MEEEEKEVKCPLLTESKGGCLNGSDLFELAHQVLFQMEDEMKKVYEDRMPYFPHRFAKKREILFKIINELGTCIEPDPDFPHLKI